MAEMAADMGGGGDLGGAASPGPSGGALTGPATSGPIETGSSPAPSMPDLGGGGSSLGGRDAIETPNPGSSRLTDAPVSLPGALPEHPVALASSLPSGYDPTGLRTPLAPEINPYREIGLKEAQEATARMSADGSDIHDAYRRGSTFPIADPAIRQEVETQAGGNPNHARDLTYLASVARNAQGNETPNFTELARNNSVKLDKGDAQFLAANYRQIGESADYRTHLPGVLESYDSNIRSIETRSALNGGTMTPGDLDHQVRSGVVMSPSGYTDGMQPLTNLYPRSANDVPMASSLLREYGIEHARNAEGGIAITDTRIPDSTKKLWENYGAVK